MILDQHLPRRLIQNLSRSSDAQGFTGLFAESGQ